MAGAAIIAIGSAIDSTTEKGKKWSDSIKGLGTSLVAFGTTFRILDSVGKSIKSLEALSGGLGLGIAGGIAAITAVVEIYDALNESEAEKEERLNKHLQ